ncbi:MAG: DUF480 domain-containing protein [Methylophilaceae bacterium]
MAELYSLLETRVLGALIEKSITVPDSYPLTLNSLLAACNQKTSRVPVIESNIADIQTTLDALRRRSLILETHSGRTAHYAHNAGRVFRVDEAGVALLAVLMLRGPQTLGELRINADRMVKFTDTAAVEAKLVELSERDETAGRIERLTQLLPKVASAREARWCHLLSGEPLVNQYNADITTQHLDAVSASEVDILKKRISALEQKLAEFEAWAERLNAELGLSMNIRQE